MSRCLSLILVVGLVAIGCNSSTRSESARATSPQGATSESRTASDAAPTAEDQAADEHLAHAHAGREHRQHATFGAAAREQPAAEPAAEASLPGENLTAAADPEAVVTAFLEATRRGDDRIAANLLSEKALQETSKMGLAVKPPGTPTMQYTIEQVEFPDGVADGAYVHSLWSEQAAGDDSYRITWILRKQSAGWRIVGMAAEMSDSEPPYFLNFEQPQDLYRRIQDAEREVADAAEGPAARTAAGPPPLSR